MDNLPVVLPKSQKIVLVKVDRKKMKTCRLKIYPDQTAIISVPFGIPDDLIQNFLNQKSLWIEKKLEQFAATSGYASTNEICNGQSIKMFGEDLIFAVAQSNKNCIYREGRNICISNSDISDQEKLMKQFDRWWRREALDFLKTRVKELHPIIGKYGKPQPQIYIRKMRTLWGSCSVNRQVITFNQYLIKARPACIDYVVLHELSHFIYPNHSKQFYDFLSIHMPDWRERKKILDQDVVHGL